MKGDTPLDYAEFQLTPKRTRCELFISADGLMEKLASGFVKPFVTHLRAVEVQAARGNQVIRLESQAGFAKHHRHQQCDNGWFCKGTMERFVRFVSTPEVIERVKTIEDELTQLEQVRSTLVNTFAQTTDRFAYSESTSGRQQSRDGTHSAPRRFSTDTEGNEADASQRELLRAMEARLNALHQEQNMAFSRAGAAGFDNNSIADLMTFAEHFGAERLSDACTQFLALSQKRTAPRREQECTNSPTIETPSDGSECTLASGFGSEEARLHAAKRKLDFGANKVQTNNSGGLEAKEAGPVRRDSRQLGASTLSPTEQSTEPSASGAFLARLQQMAQQVEARSSEDFGWQMDAETNEPSFQSSENDADNLYKHGDSMSSFPRRSSSLPALKVRTEGPRLWNPSSVEARSGKDPSEDEVTKAKDSAKPEETSGMEADKSNSQSAQGEVPARRLSVQAAISLFESKKKETNEPPFRKLIKQESRKSMTEGCSSPSEKSVLKRWGGASPCSPDANSVQEKKTSDSGGVERQREPEFVKVKDEANKVPSSERMVDAQSQPAPDEKARENFKKSLSSLLHFDSTLHHERSGASRGVDAELQPIQQPSSNTAGSTLGLESKARLSLDRSKTLPMTKMDAGVSSKAELEPSSTVMPADVKSLKKPVIEVKPESQPAPQMTSLEYNGKVEQEHKDEGFLKGQETKEIMPKPVESVSHRPKISAQVSTPASTEQVHMGPIVAAFHKTESMAAAVHKTEPIAAAVHKAEQVFDKRAETIKHKEGTGSDRQTGKKASYGKSSSIQKKGSSVKELSTNSLTNSVDLNMQALAKMVEHQYTNLSLNGVELPNEQKGEQRGRFYDQYSKLRDAKLRGEHPAKRAEKEAKLKSMQETLERRKAEMETRAVKLSKKKVRDARVADSGRERTQPQKADLTVAMVEQKDLKDEEDDTDQEEYSLRLQDQTLDYSNPTSPASTPRSSKNSSSALKSRAPTKTMPTLPKSSSAPRNPTRAAASSPRSTPKNPGGAPSQGRPSNSSGDTPAVKAVLNIKDVAKSSLIRATASARVHPRFNAYSSDAVTLGDDANNTAQLANTEKKELRNPSLVTRKNVATNSVSRSLPAEAGMLLGSPKDQQEGATDAMIDGKSPQSSGVTQDVKPFLRKGRGIGPGAGPGIMKQKASILADTSKGSDEDTSTDCKEDGVSLNPEDLGVSSNPEDLEVSSNLEDLQGTAENFVEIHETEDVGVVRKEEEFPTTDVAMLPTVNDESTPSSSRPSSGLTDSGDMEALDYLPKSVSENDKQSPDTISPHVEHLEGSRPGIENRAAEGSFLHHKQKEGTFMLSDLLSQRNAESLPPNSGYVTSSISFREGSLPHGQIGSPFPASVSHAYSSMLQRGAVSSRFSPPRTNALDLPTSSPALWNVSQASKYIPEPDLIHSSRHQKPASMLPLPPKEPSKGLKRLLHFGRKSRPSEATTTDCVSVSTTSEGDDDADEVREFGSQLSDELLRKIRMQKKGFEYGNMGDHYSFPDQDTCK
eukprot:c18470_g1_i3 orf=922-5472(-)